MNEKESDPAKGHRSETRQGSAEVPPCRRSGKDHGLRR